MKIAGRSSTAATISLRREGVQCYLFPSVRFSGIEALFEGEMVAIPESSDFHVSRHHVQVDRLRSFWWFVPVDGNGTATTLALFIANELDLIHHTCDCSSDAAWIRDRHSITLLENVVNAVGIKFQTGLGQLDDNVMKTVYEEGVFWHCFVGL